MQLYVIEAYQSRARTGQREQLSRRARAAVESLSRQGVAVRYVRAVLLPEDEMWFLFLEASTEDAVVEVARRARLPFERVVEAVE
jgi:hypothetical protein